MKASKRGSIPPEPVKTSKLSEADERRVVKAVKLFARRLRALGDYIPEIDNLLVEGVCRAAVYSLKVERLLDRAMENGTPEEIKLLSRAKANLTADVRSGLEDLAATGRVRKGVSSRENLEAMLWDVLRAEQG